MKKLISRVIMIVVIALSFSAAAEAQIYVKVRPAHPVIKVKPHRPTPSHIWISGEWTWGDGRYNYRDGYWDRPRYRNDRWIDGRWKHSRRGWVWVPGHWRRR